MDNQTIRAAEVFGRNLCTLRKTSTLHNYNYQKSSEYMNQQYQIGNMD